MPQGTMCWVHAEVQVQSRAGPCGLWSDGDSKLGLKGSAGSGCVRIEGRTFQAEVEEG